MLLFSLVLERLLWGVAALGVGITDYTHRGNVGIPIALAIGYSIATVGGFSFVVGTILLRRQLSTNAQGMFELRLR